MSTLIYTFNSNGNECLSTTDSALLEDPEGNQIQVNQDTSCIHISLSGTSDDSILTIENGFLSIGSLDSSPKVWCRYIKGTFYFCVWSLYKGEFYGFFGISSDTISKTPITGRSFLKYMMENPDKSIDNYIRNTIFTKVINNTKKCDEFLKLVRY